MFLTIFQNLTKKTTIFICFMFFLISNAYGVGDKVIYQGETGGYNDFIQYYYNENLFIKNIDEFAKLRSLNEELSLGNYGVSNEYVQLHVFLAEQLKHVDMFIKNYQLILSGDSYSEQEMRFSTLTLLLESESYLNFRVNLYEMILLGKLFENNGKFPPFEPNDFNCNHYKEIGVFFNAEYKLIGWAGYTQSFFSLIECDNGSKLFYFDQIEKKWVLFTESDFFKFFDSVDINSEPAHFELLKKLKNKINKNKRGQSQLN